MAPPRWTTSEELEWLQNELPDFLKMQRDQKLTRFYELLFPRWFSQFPEHLKYWKPTSNPLHEGEVLVQHQNDENGVLNSDESGLLPLTPEQEAKLEEANEIRRKAKQKLREWFRNNAKSKTTPGSTSTSKAFAHLLGQRARGVRDLKDIEVYSKAYYKKKIQPLVEDDVLENQLNSKKRIGVVQKHTNSCFAAESEEVKAEIREETARINASRKLGSIVSDARTKEEIYRAIQELPIVLGQICEDLATLTGGWHFSLIMGGSDPMCKGDIMTLSFHHGKGQDGLSFKASNLNFHEQYLLPFEKHLKRAFGCIDGASTRSSSLIPNLSPPPSHFASPNAQNDSEEHIPVAIESLMAIPDQFPPAPSNFTSPNAQHNSAELHAPLSVESLMDPNFPVCEAQIDAFLSTIGPLTNNGENPPWWYNQSKDMQMIVPPVVNPPPAMVESCTPVINPPPAMVESHTQGWDSLMVGDSSTPPHIRRAVPTPPHICRARSGAIPSPLSKSPQFPPVDMLHMANSEGYTLPVMTIPESTPTGVISSTSLNDMAAANSTSPPPVSSALVDTASIPTSPDTLLPGGSVPLVSSAPGRRSMRTTRPSTRAKDANKIGDDAKAIACKRKRKSVTSSSTAPIAVKSTHALIL
ncbi:hypothetical protein F4604DRAFT_1689053 [Suillus subluteus]|nr:hypothetical protein F4604DRAFT_1689053 [Suillus subluteus]